MTIAARSVASSPGFTWRWTSDMRATSERLGSMVIIFMPRLRPAFSRADGLDWGMLS